MSIQQQQQPMPIVLLREGSSETKGNQAQRNNITAAKMMVEISKATDNEVGDGTTSTVVLAGSLLSKAEELIAKDVHPTVIVDGYRMASEKAIEILKKASTKVDAADR